MGNKGTISSGDVQWMTAGSCIIRQEMPKDDPDGLMLGFRLWANPPKSRKMMEPRYRDVKSEQITEVVIETGTKIKIICGKMAAMINKHSANVLTYCRQRVTNEVAEGLNSKIMFIKRRACGYRNKEHFKTANYFFCGGLNLYPC